MTKTILKLLEDPDILKIGVGILDEDVKRFKLQWNIAPQGSQKCSFVDGNIFSP